MDCVGDLRLFKMAASLEQTLLKLLVPDNNVILEATRELRDAFRDPGICSALCGVLCTAQSPQVRQYAAVLLRRKLCKKRQWSALSPENQLRIKQMMLHRLVLDPEKPVRTAVAELIGTLAKHELPQNSWPELLQFVQENVKSSDPAFRELGMFMLSTIAANASAQLRPHLKSLLSSFDTSLQDSENKMVSFYTVKTLSSLVCMVEPSEMNLLQNLIPKVILLIRRWINEDEEQAWAPMELFDEMVEAEIKLDISHIKVLVELYLEIAGNADLQEVTQVKAMNFISWLIQMKKKVIIKYKLVAPILKTLFPIMCRPVDDDDEDIFGVEATETTDPGIIAAQVIDTMALHLPPEKVMQPLLQLVEPAFVSADPYCKKAAYVAIAVTSEGCADYIRTKHLHVFLQSVCKGITDSNTVVRNAAFYALGQFSEYLQPEISKYASELLPVLFDYLSQTCEHLQQDTKDPPGMSRMFYAVELFSENLGNDLLPYLPTLMERLLIILNCAKSAAVRELAISAIGATAMSATEDMVPYFPQIIGHLKVYLTDAQPEENLSLQIQAIETLGSFARTIGAVNFMPLCDECIKYGLDLVIKVNDPDLRRSIYNLFASVSTVLKESMAPYLPSIIPLIIDTLQSTEGLMVDPYKEEENVFPLIEDEEDDEEDLSMTEDDDNEDSGDETNSYYMENGYLDEKEEACSALREIAANVKLGFLPFLQQCSEEVYKLLEYESHSIQKVALRTVGELCCNLHHAVTTNNSPNEGKEVLSRFLDNLVPKLVIIINTDKDRELITTAIETLTELLKNVRESVLENPDHLTTIVQCAFNAMTGKILYQEDEVEGDSDENRAEYDSMLIECASEIIPELALAMPADQFTQYFRPYFLLLLPKLQKQRPVSERSFAVGMLAQSCENMGEGVKQFVDDILPIFLNMVKDDDDEVRANSIFGLGMLVEQGKEALYSHYPTILQVLSAALAKETNMRAADNICGAVARLIMTNINEVPMDQVFPVLIRCLPLKEDFDENPTVFRCFSYLLHRRHPQVFNHLSEIFKVCSHVLGSKQLNEEGHNIVMQILQTVHEEFPREFQVVISSLPAETVEKLRIATI